MGQYSDILEQNEERQGQRQYGKQFNPPRINCKKTDAENNHNETVNVIKENETNKRDKYTNSPDATKCFDKAAQLNHALKELWPKLQFGGGCEEVAVKIKQQIKDSIKTLVDSADKLLESHSNEIYLKALENISETAQLALMEKQNKEA